MRFPAGLFILRTDHWELKLIVTPFSAQPTLSVTSSFLCLRSLLAFFDCILSGVETGTNSFYGALPVGDQNAPLN
jgi:hypothetical protein